MPLKTPEDDIEFHISKLEMKPGDVLVARLMRIVPSEVHTRLRAFLERSLPGTRVVVIDATLELSVVSKSEAKRLTSASV